MPGRFLTEKLEAEVILAVQLDAQGIFNNEATQEIFTDEVESQGVFTEEMKVLGI